MLIICRSDGWRGGRNERCGVWRAPEKVDKIDEDEQIAELQKTSADAAN
ncbi:hypothetical protein ABH999_000713 [Bradyrhizobium yuanmingense]